VKKKLKNHLDARSHKPNFAGNEPGAKANLPEPRSVQKTISYQFSILPMKPTTYAKR
jgi:hypothetical protein